MNYPHIEKNITVFVCEDNILRKLVIEHYREIYESNYYNFYDLVSSLSNPLEFVRFIDDSKGVVIIEGFGDCLHPKHQRGLYENLISTFPNVKFILTTHSPIVCVYLRKNYSSIFALENNQIKSIDYYYGKDVNSLLSQFGINRRPKEIQDKIDLMYQYYEDEQKEEAYKIYEELLYFLGKDDIDILEFEAYKEYN